MSQDRSSKRADAQTQSRWGAQRIGEGRWRFGLWAPSADKVALQLGGAETPMTRGEDGFWQVEAAAETGTEYMFVIDGEARPDPAARRQAGDVHGASVLADPGAREWTSKWVGRAWEEAVIYEVHVGTFTEEGTFAAAAKRMQELADLGITAIEIMPVGQWQGDRGWGYDGVLPYAPHPAYGTPEELQDLVEAAQSAGLMVLLDVVYNHFGPDGAYLHAYAPEFFEEARHTPWGAAIDFTKPAVREFFVENALYWLRDYRLDGLRLDAVHQIQDPSPHHVLVELGERVRDAGLDRPVHLVTEDERNEPELRDTKLYAASWNDDYHHAVHVALTGESEGYYKPFAHDPIGDLVLALGRGHVEEGQPRPGRETRRGRPAAHLPWTGFVNSNQTHDQVGNRAVGERLLSLADPRGVEVAHAMLLTSPFVPMLFMGEEAGETAPFLFFCDHEGELARLTREGRQREFEHFAGFSGEVPDPNARETFERSHPFRGEADHMAHWRGLTRDLLTLRAEKIVPLMKSGRAGDARVARTGPRALSALWPFRDGHVVARINLGSPPDTPPTAEPHDFAIGDPAADPFAFAVIVSRH
ncbi:malto-oligosyltrehalose trehalohydrolase [Limimaricola pyoseonensis]|uniref:Malto-oligosyltrehalose trehalohydrolase n=1 Tax=Limimaricola pyoseonensis TaxID=521013 RepID=A0A1G7BWE4_9RHOB|nr:malto-oligosyltrehalose trehalohydrolase [Limimaricola pyoseonensis]SDE31322.1 malto-oligosyltrehalose trehalohydrolase [Limimaricola pyoseonensis]